MLAVTVTFILSTVVLALGAQHMIAVIEGNEALLGLPSDSGIPVFLGVVIAGAAAGTLLAPFAVALQRLRSSRRPLKRRMR